MPHSTWSWLALLASFLSTSTAKNYADTVNLYYSLAPCAQSAVSNGLNLQASAQSCRNSNNDNNDIIRTCLCNTLGPSATVQAAISMSVGSACGSAATDDMTQASIVLNAYCSPAQGFAFASIGTGVGRVTQYPMDLPAYSNLGSCAASVFSTVAANYTSKLCQTDVNSVARCMCIKNTNSVDITNSAIASLRSNCDSSDDISSVGRLFSDYCNMVENITSFATPRYPPGDMTYYIDDIPEYTNLERCAQSALANAFTIKAISQCPQGPQAIASCMCIKNGMSRAASIFIESSVNYLCNSYATDASSAVSLFQKYCSAAQNKIVIAAVTSRTQTYANDGSFSVSSATDSPANGDGEDADSDSHHRKLNLGAIIGGTLGGVILLVAGGVFLMIRRRRQHRQKATLTSAFPDALSALPPNTSELPTANTTIYEMVSTPAYIPELTSQTSQPSELPSLTSPTKLAGHRTATGVYGDWKADISAAETDADTPVSGLAAPAYADWQPSPRDVGMMNAGYMPVGARYPALAAIGMQTYVELDGSPVASPRLPESPGGQEGDEGGRQRSKLEEVRR